METRKTGIREHSEPLETLLKGEEWKWKENHGQTTVDDRIAEIIRNAVFPSQVRVVYTWLAYE